MVQVDDILETKLDRKFQLLVDKGTLDAIGLHPDGPVKRYYGCFEGLAFILLSLDICIQESPQVVASQNQPVTCRVMTNVLWERELCEHQV